jgi:hypothetical protein
VSDYGSWRSAINAKAMRFGKGGRTATPKEMADLLRPGLEGQVQWMPTDQTAKRLREKGVPEDEIRRTAEFGERDCRMLALEVANLEGHDSWREVPVPDWLQPKYDHAARPGARPGDAQVIGTWEMRPSYG